MPKFSIVVPIYNVEEYLPRCIESLQNQTLEDIEIILVDDGSPDRCPAICDEYEKKDHRIHVIHKQNGGVSAARNDGLDAATGEYVICCDSDDWMEPDACEIMYNSGVESGADVIITDVYRIIDGERKYCKLYNEPFIYTNKEDIDELIYSVFYQNMCNRIPSKENVTGYGGPWNKAARLEFLNHYHIRFDPSVKGVFDDRLFALYAYANAKTIAYVQEPTYNYVWVGSGITKTYKQDILDTNERVFAAFRNFLEKYDMGEMRKQLFSAVVVVRLKEALALNYFSKKNPHGLVKNCAEVSKVIKREPYKTALKTIDTNRLQKLHRITAQFLKAHLVLPLGIMYGMYSGKQ